MLTYKKILIAAVITLQPGCSTEPDNTMPNKNIDEGR